MPDISKDELDKPNWTYNKQKQRTRSRQHGTTPSMMPSRGEAESRARADLRVDVAEAGDHVIGGVHLGLLAGGREHDGVGVVPGADGEVPGQVGGLRLRATATATAVAGAVASAGDDALPDVGYQSHLRYLRQVLPGEAPLRAELPVAVNHRGVGARLRVAPHPSGRGHSCVRKD